MVKGIRKSQVNLASPISTVKNILRTVMDKMDVSSRTLIVIKYYKNLIEQEEEGMRAGSVISILSVAIIWFVFASLAIVIEQTYPPRIAIGKYSITNRTIKNSG